MVELISLLVSLVFFAMSVVMMLIPLFFVLALFGGIGLVVYLGSRSKKT